MSNAVTTPATAAPDDGFDCLLLSDIHLGSDLVPHLRPWAETSWLRAEAEVDPRLVALFDHYRREHAPERRWRLVIAGDFLDLVGVSMSPVSAHLRTPPTPEEQRHGLGSAADHVVRKVRAIAARHPSVFEALMRFLAAGHRLVVVRGNHDIELHWRAAQRALIDAIVQHAAPEARRELARRIEICPWYFAIEGLLYVEHGHEFDPMCSYGDPLLPTCPRDPRRIRSTPFSVLLRQVARPTRGVSSASHGYAGMGAYAVLLAKIGVAGSVRLAVRYARACARLVGECFTQALDRGRRRLNVARACLRRFVARTGADERKLSALRALYERPAAQSLDFVVRSLYLDRIFCLMLAAGLVVAAGLTIPWSAQGALWCSIPAAVFGGYACIGRGSNTSPEARMRAGAERIAGLFGVRCVVMGHTHQPVFDAMGESATYVNLGSWGQDDPPDELAHAHASSSTFLSIRRVDDRYRVELLRWHPAGHPAPLG